MNNIYTKKKKNKFKRKSKYFIFLLKSSLKYLMCLNLNYFFLKYDILIFNKNSFLKANTNLTQI